MLLVVTIIISFLNNPSSVILGSMVDSVFIYNLIFEITNRNNFDKLYGTLPIRKDEIVKTRYLITLLYLSAVGNLLFLRIVIHMA